MSVSNETIQKKASFWRKNQALVIGVACWIVGCLCGGVLMAGGKDLATPDSKPSPTPKVTMLSSQGNQPGPAKQAEPVEPAKPLPTYTPLAAVEPQIIFVTATLLPDWQLMQTFTGSGKYTTEFFPLPSGIVRIKWDFVGDGNFAFYLKRLDTDAEELLENEIGNTNGQKIMKIGASDRYVIDVHYGDGSWTITVEFMP